MFDICLALTEYAQLPQIEKRIKGVESAMEQYMWERGQQALRRATYPPHNNSKENDDEQSEASKEAVI